VWYTYCAAYTNVTSAFLWVGTSLAAHSVFTYPVSKLIDGRFTCCHVPRYDFDSIVGAGGTDWNNILYIAIGFNFALETNALASLVVSELSHRPSAGQATDVPGASLAGEVALVSAADPVLIAGQAVPLSINTAGQTRVALSSVEGAPDALAPARALLTGAIANAVAPTPDETDMGALSMTLFSELRTRIDLAQVALGADIAAQAVQMGAQAHSAVPAAVTNGKQTTPLTDLYSRLKLAAHDDSSGSLLATLVNEGPRATFTPGAHVQLVAAGSTPSIDIKGFSSFCYQVLVATIDTTAVVRIEGNNDDGANWFNCDGAGVDTVLVANGLFGFEASGVSYRYVRFTFVSETGGAAVTLDVTPIAGR